MRMTGRLNFIFGIIFSVLLLAANGSANTFYVSNTNDGGFGSLRQAILEANDSLDIHDVIEINIPGGGTKVINLLSPLPAIKPDRADCGFGSTVMIDATKMPGYAGVPLVELNGTSAGGANGLTIIWGIVTVKGMAINRFAQWGIYAKHDGAQHNPQCAGNDPPFTALKLYGSRIGTDPSGTLDRGNGAGGVYVDGNYTSYIGGAGANEGNVISGNVGNGIELEGQSAYIVGNKIGTNLAGNAAIPNSFNGIKTDSGWISIYNNVISGNGIDGIQMKDPVAGYEDPSLIQGNRIGTNDAGTADLGNTANGINVTNAGDKKLLIGGNQAWMANVVSGNNQNGIMIKAERAWVQGNFIGTNATGTQAIPNTASGVYMTVLGSIIGGEQSGQGNVISGNGGNGVRVEIVDSSYWGDIVGNKIGTNANGTAAIPNDNSGVTASVQEESVFGVELHIRLNVISGNTSHGVYLTDGASAVEVANNYIGTNAILANVGNGGNGVYAFGTAQSSKIEANVIAYNAGDGVSLQPAFGGASATEIKIAANSIFSNGGLGIDLGPTNGLTPNDVGDGDSGPNGLQNFPVIQTATTTTLSGSLNSNPNSDFEIHFYRTDACDASGYGEGRFYLGKADTSTDASGNATFSANFNLAAGQIVVATASGYNSSSYFANTSEFSQCKTVIQTQPGNFVFGAATFNVNEGNGSLILAVNRTGGSDGTVTVNYGTTNGTAIAGQDYTTTSGTLTFTQGQTVKNVTIPITNDPNDEPDQNFTFALSSPTGGANIGNPGSAVVTIIDNDSPPTVSINDLSIVEGNEGLTAYTFDISLSAASAFATAVNWTTAQGGTATVGVDYQANNGTVNFPAGDTTKQITVQVYGETLVEINETFNVTLSSPTMATIGDGTGVGTITDDDNPGKFSFSLAPYNVNEGAGNATVTVVRSNGDAGTATVDYTTTAAGTSTPFADFTPVSGTLVFLDGELQKTFTVPVLEDQIAEQSESIALLLSNTTGGAALGLSSAVINILDNDSGTPLAISGSVRKADNSPIPGVTVNLAGTQSATATTDANGEYSFSSLTPGGNYSVTPSAIGYTFTPISHQYANLAASVTNASFTGTPAPSRALRVVGTDAVPGQAATAVIELVAQGDENSVGFSLVFDPAVLSSPQVVLTGDALSANLVINDSQAASGKLGVIIALPAGQSFAAGTRQLASITFASSVTAQYGTPLTFGDVPVQKQIVNVNADPLPAAYTNGSISFAQGYEADVAPRPTGTGNGTVTVADFTQIGRFVAGLNTPDQTNEFQRSDVAPRISKGNGSLTVSDYTQAGRYAAGLDPVQTAGGAVQASLLAPESSLAMPDDEPGNIVRSVRVVDVQGGPGQQVFVPVRITSEGDENSFGFSLSYDVTKIANPVVSLGADAAGATLIVNANTPGKLGVLLGLPAGTSLASGDRHLVNIRFDVAAGVQPGLIPINFGDQPIGREIVDADVNVLAAGYTDGAISILGPTAATVSVGGRVMDATGRGIAGVNVSITDAEGNGRSAVTGLSGYYTFYDVEAGRAYMIAVSSKRHHFDPASRAVVVADSIANIDFTAQAATSFGSESNEP